MRTTLEQRATFSSRGYLDGPRVLSNTDADDLAEECRRMVLDPEHPVYGSVPRASCEPFLHVPHVEIDRPAFWSLHREPTLVDTICELLDVDNIQLFERHLFYKPANEIRIRAWHQDTEYLPFQRPFRAMVVWVSLEGATAASGALVMVPGSHRMGELPAGLDTDLSDEALRLAGVAAEGEHRTVAKGHAHLHDPAVWHGSGGNSTNRGRSGLSLIFVERGTRFDSSGPFARFFSGDHGESIDEGRHPVCR